MSFETSKDSFDEFMNEYVEISENEIRQNRIPDVLDKLEKISSEVSKAERKYFAIKVLSQASKYVMGYLRDYHVEIIPDYKSNPISVKIIIHLD